MSPEHGTIIENRGRSFPKFCWRTIATYLFAYTISGAIAQLYYRPIWHTGALAEIMRPMDSPWVALGPALQAVNALVMAIILYPFFNTIIVRKNGWALFFLLIAGFSIFVPQSPAPGSFEGLIYTKLSLYEHIIGLPETLLFSFLFSFGLYQWYRKPGKLWNILSIVVCIAIILISMLGFLAAIGIIPHP